jgi:hypothetical protein
MEEGRAVLVRAGWRGWECRRRRDGGGGFRLTGSGRRRNMNRRRWDGLHRPRRRRRWRREVGVAIRHGRMGLSEWSPGGILCLSLRFSSSWPCGWIGTALLSHWQLWSIDLTVRIVSLIVHYMIQKQFRCQDYKTAVLKMQLKWNWGQENIKLLNPKLSFTSSNRGRSIRKNVGFNVIEYLRGKFNCTL